MSDSLPGLAAAVKLSACQELTDGAGRRVGSLVMGRDAPWREDLEAVVKLAQDWVALLEKGHPRQGVSGEDAYFLARWLLHLAAEVSRLKARLEKAERKRDEWKNRASDEGGNWWDAFTRACRAEAEVERLRGAIEDYGLWRPGERGHAAAHKRLLGALAATEKPGEKTTQKIDEFRRNLNASLPSVGQPRQRR